MKRWAIVIALLGAFGFALFGTGRFQSAAPAARPEIVDEILAFDVSPPGITRLKLPAATDQVALSAWCVIGRAPQLNEHFPFGLEVTWLDAQQKPLAKRTFDLESRISGEILPSGHRDDYVAKLADGTEWVTDTRTLMISTQGLSAPVAALELRASQGANPHVLVRASFRQQRSSLERMALEESLDQTARLKLIEGRSSLGWEDLTLSSQSDALAVWGRRLDAKGQEGTDYRVQRVLLGPLHPSNPAVTGAILGFDIGPGHKAALNVKGPVTLWIQGPPQRSVRVQEGPVESLRIFSLGSEGMAEVALEGQGPRTVFFDAGEAPEFRAHFFVQQGDSHVQIGEQFPVARQKSRVEIMPDLRVYRVAKLDSDKPLAVRLAQGQKLLGVDIRGEIAGGELLEAHLKARFLGAKSQTERTLPVVLLRSPFDRWRTGADATEPQSSMLLIPPGTERVEFIGDPSLRLGFWTEDPEISEDVLQEPYQVKLAEKQHWRNAPYDIRKRTAIRPEQEPQLEQDGRIIEVLAQVRIDSPAQVKMPLPEKVLVLEGSPMQRHFLEPGSFAQGMAFPPDAWTSLDSSKDILVPSAGDRAQRVRVNYLVSLGRLGQPVRLLVDGKEAASQIAMSRAGELEASIPWGIHRLEIADKTSGDMAFVDAPPSPQGAIVRRRQMARLEANQDIVFRWTQGPMQSMSLVLFVVTEEIPGAWSVQYSIDNGKPAMQLGHFFHLATVAEGQLQGVGGDAGKGYFWETGLETGVQGLSKTKIRLGDDLAVGEHRIRLRLGDSSNRVWVRAVLVGQEQGPKTVQARVWAEEER